MYIEFWKLLLETITAVSSKKFSFFYKWLYKAYVRSVKKKTLKLFDIFSANPFLANVFISSPLKTLLAQWMVSVWSTIFSWTGLREIDENQSRETSKNNVVKILDGQNAKRKA